MTTLRERLKTNERYQSTLRPLSSDEFAQLQFNILSANEFLSPILYHLSEAGDEVVVDGHNRLAVWGEHQDSKDLYPPICKEVTELSGASEEEVIGWIRDNQKGRRNDETLWEKYETGKEVAAAKKTGISSSEYAADNGMSASEARHAAKLAAVVDEAEEAEPGIRDQILGNENMSAAGAIKAASEVAQIPTNPMKSFEAIHKLLGGLSRAINNAETAFPNTVPVSFDVLINGLTAHVNRWEEKCLQGVE